MQDPPAFKQEVAAARSSGKLKIDALGISLIVIGFACLEMVLDRGQIEDWFGSNRITVLFTIACICLVTAVIWEWRHKDPLVELSCLGLSFSAARR